MIQLAGCQVAQVSQGGKIDIRLGCDEEVYADLHATGSCLTLAGDHPIKHLVSILGTPPMRHRGLPQHWLNRSMPDRHVCRVIWHTSLKKMARLEFSSICSHVPVGFGSRLLQLLPILIAS